MKKMLLSLAVVLACVSMTSVCCGADVKYPDVFPKEWKAKELLESEKRALAPGVDYYHFHFKDFRDGEPLSMYMMIIDWKKTQNLKLVVGVSQDKLRRVPDLVAFDNAKHGDRLIASVNGAYFHFKEVKSYFAIKGRGIVYEPRDKGNYFSDGALVSKGTEFPKIVKPTPEIMNEYDNLIQGYWLGRDGVNSRGGMKKDDRTPYTVVGVNPEKEQLVIFVNDGRHKKDSPGIAFNEIPDFLFALGCTQVLSIDGGGSSTVALPSKADPAKLEVVNHPSDNKLFDHNGTRAIQNCVYLVEESKR